MNCSRCKRPMKGTNAYDGACACGGLIANATDICWMDKHIEEQREQRELMDRITAPYTAEELSEFVTEEVIKGTKKKKINAVELVNAAKFVNSERGRYIIAQALFVASRTMKAVPEPRTEHSNIGDMEYMLDNLFPHYKAVLGEMQQMQSAQRRGL